VLTSPSLQVPRQGPIRDRPTLIGCPFLAAPFQAAGIIRLPPLFYGALGCLGLFFGARRWLGRYGGAAAVGAVLLLGCGATVCLARLHADVH
jgi:hypothetical protein